MEDLLLKPPENQLDRASNQFQTLINSTPLFLLQKKLMYKNRIFFNQLTIGGN
jgi:hypothetical protein